VAAVLVALVLRELMGLQIQVVAVAVVLEVVVALADLE
jgi:hypothetical protein